ncbi:hypothetical protein ABBQ38_002256 [Trebouxia sp. C0009 RCD-2024]
MSPELLGWHEQHGIDCGDGSEGASPLSPESASEQTPSFYFTRLPASVSKSKSVADRSGLGKAVRVKTPASRARVSRSELRGLGGGSPPRAARDMGSIALLSPVRADSHINRQLGAAKVVTPVRRSARKSAATPLIASMLRETEFAYAPNDALSCRRHPIFDSPAEASNAGTDTPQPDDDAASTPTSITGVSLAGDVILSAESPGLQAEASATTSSSQSPSLLCQTPSVSPTLLEAALSPEPSAAGSTPDYGCLHRLHAASSFLSGSQDVTEQEPLTETTNKGLPCEALVTPPPARKPSPQGPTTRSKSARKGGAPPGSGTRQKRTVDSPSLSPTEARIRDGLRRSVRLLRESRTAAN